MGSDRQNLLNKRGHSGKAIRHREDGLQCVERRFWRERSGSGPNTESIHSDKHHRLICELLTFCLTARGECECVIYVGQLLSRLCEFIATNIIISQMQQIFR